MTGVTIGMVITPAATSYTMQKDMVVHIHYNLGDLGDTAKRMTHRLVRIPIVVGHTTLEPPKEGHDFTDSGKFPHQEKN